MSAGVGPQSQHGLKEEVFYFRQAGRVPNLVNRKPHVVRTAMTVNYASTARAWSGLGRGNDFAVRWSGFLIVKTAGSYKFSLISDDGSKLSVDSSEVVNNDGLHGMRNREGKKVLTLGLHKLLLEFFEKGGRAGMVFKYSGPDSGNKMVVVPSQALQQMTGFDTCRTGGLK